eukprot:2299732-Rhodomonas_salina.2
MEANLGRGNQALGPITSPSWQQHSLRQSRPLPGAFALWCARPRCLPAPPAAADDACLGPAHAM